MEKTALRQLYEDMMYKGKTQPWEHYLQIEKEQIAKSWHDGNLLGRNGWIQEEYTTGTQYYNHTYEK